MEQKGLTVLLSEEEIQAKIAEIGKKIHQDYNGKELIVIGVLKGAIIFFADLVRAIDQKIQIDFINVKSYFGGTRSTGKVVLFRDIQVDIEGKHLLLVDDIYDTGYTLDFIKTLLEKRNPASVELCVLLHKNREHERDLPLKYRVFDIPDEFVVGYGLDYDEYYRNLPYIGILNPEELEC